MSIWMKVLTTEDMVTSEEFAPVGLFLITIVIITKVGKVLLRNRWKIYREKCKEIFLSTFYAHAFGGQF